MTGQYTFECYEEDAQEAKKQLIALAEKHKITLSFVGMRIERLYKWHVTAVTDAPLALETFEEQLYEVFDLGAVE